MLRRSFLQSLGAGAAVGAAMAPSLPRAQSATTLRFIPQLDLAYLDPVFSTAYVTRNHGYLVFDTLYGVDTDFNVHPQMVAGHVVEQDGLLWTLTLRDGLVWHDGERVLARDCVASIRRYAKRDPFGEALMAATEELSAPDDRSIRFRLKKPFPLLPMALGKPGSPMPAMMPARLAETDPFRQVTEMVGSGPFRYLADERVPGARNAYARFERYQPRPDGTPNWTSGPKRVHFDRVVWTTQPDAGTAASAMLAGEQDWMEYAYHDVLPLLRRSRQIRISVPDPTGFVTMLRINHLQPPFDKPAVRRALFGAVDQSAFMEAIVGNDSSMYRTPLGYFAPGTPMATPEGLGFLQGERDYEKVKRDLAAAGYQGEKVVLLVPADSVGLKAQGDVAADMMRRAGMNVDYLATDWGTLLARRNRKDPPEQGGWSAFVSSWAGADWLNPAVHLALRGNGVAYPGWSQSPRTEALRQQWFEAPDLAAQQAICREIQKVSLEEVPYYPLGNYIQPTAHRTSVTGLLGGFATFWNIRPS
ncbi:ABC transporter substrate-binding protein [Pseudoroseomonas cervicalis]|uniref:Tat pathway signal sequence domain protein n=1 Tax=Pseudoroseomonas cervicalis ATCC 49957 TaxID=525371 RepID=D5RIW0_9PROT|nr:ABC transporter substrate-binding protein [Pseudoroseomonas cervicalis]EFH12782.1 Tat pathway signal sequence domain protein [Pseudoroseomonas cervicalis ATCC 49957]